jgi:beta-glucanase (GH16 family)
MLLSSCDRMPAPDSTTPDAAGESPAPAVTPQETPAEPAAETTAAAPAPAVELPAGWTMVFEENFEGAPDMWKPRWNSDATAHKHILSSRWPENVTVEDGTLKLLNKKESKAGRDWTSGSIWTKNQFQYGYFECRYKIGAAHGLNNAFWLMNRAEDMTPEERVKLETGEVVVFEIDINEGHYPNEINTNIHRWTPTRSSKSQSFRMGASAASSFPLEIPITTDRLRVISRDLSRVSIMELRAFSPTKEGYPELLDDKGNPLPLPEGRTNLLEGGAVSATSQLKPELGPENAVDGQTGNSSRWVTDEKLEAPQELTIQLASPVEIGCLQVLSGWRSEGEWKDSMSDFTIQYWKDGTWIDIADSGTNGGFVDMSANYHTYSVLWTPEEIIFYFDGKELRREKNEFAHLPAPVFLSSAVIHWSGPVTDRIDGTSMDVDYVRIWQGPGHVKRVRLATTP